MLLGIIMYEGTLRDQGNRTHLELDIAQALVSNHFIDLPQLSVSWKCQTSLFEGFCIVTNNTLDHSLSLRNLARYIVLDRE